MIVAEESYEISEPTIDSHIVKLKAANPDVCHLSRRRNSRRRPSRRSPSSSWKPLQIVTNVSASVGSVMQAGRLRECAGRAVGGLRQGRRRPQWDDDPGMKKWYAFLDKYMPGANKSDGAWSTATARRKPW